MCLPNLIHLPLSSSHSTTLITSKASEEDVAVAVVTDVLGLA